ncbi:MAG: hypothetical protein ACLTY5_11320 [Angelakisella sp.]
MQVDHINELGDLRIAAELGVVHQQGSAGKAVSPCPWDTTDP